MSERMEHPTLYGLSEAGVTLFGHRCTQCGLAGFPRQTFGCEQCGASGAALAPAELAARGVLASFALVRRHAGGDIAAPFLMGEVRLDDGPLIRCTLSAAAPTDLRIGQIMIGVLEHNPTSSADVRELRFTPEAA